LNNPSNFITIGKITKPHGLKGEVVVSLSCYQEQISKTLAQQTAHIQSTNIKLELPIIRAKLLPKKHIILQLDTIENIEQAKPLKDALLSVPKSLFSSKKGAEIYLCEVKDFVVKDQQRGQLGKIFAFSSNGAQDTLLIQSKSNKEIQIPFIKTFVIQVDFNSKTVHVNLPRNWPNIDFYS